MTQESMGSGSCGIYGFQYGGGFAYATGWGAWGWAAQWTDDAGEGKVTGLSMHVHMAPFCSTSACDFDWVLSYDGSAHRSGTSTAPDLTDFTFFARDRNGDGAWHAHPTATTNGCSGTDVLCYYHQGDSMDRNEADPATTLTWSSSSGMTGHFNEAFGGYSTDFIAPTGNACNSGWQFKELRFSNHALELQGSQLVPKSGSTGRRLQLAELRNGSR